ncbi:MAG: hypothetical protein M3P91_05695 [Actinomycetota bacterium]|nr:hypothetical protein [Actinomycetota bacterium]
MSSGQHAAQPNALWRVTLTVGGSPQPAESVRAGLEQLAQERPFLLSGRYAADRAEINYYEEAETCSDACALALRVWGEHRRTASLPPWTVIGLEVVSSELHQSRSDGYSAPLGLVSAGSWQPF